LNNSVVQFYERATPLSLLEFSKYKIRDFLKNYITNTIFLNLY
jgi:hypothetical protein